MVIIIQTMYNPDNVNEAYESSQTELWNARLLDYQAYLLLKKNRYLSKRGLFKPLCDYTAGDEFNLNAYTADQINALFAILCMNPRCNFETTRANMHRLIPDESMLRFLHHENH